MLNQLQHLNTCLANGRVKINCKQASVSKQFPQMNGEMAEIENQKKKSILIS